MTRDPAEFSDRGFSPEEAEDWIRAVFWAEGAAAWRDAGFEPEEAHVWAETGLEPTDAAQWRGLLASAASPQSERAETAEWERWRAACAAAAWWRHLGFGLEETERWLRAGFEPEDARPAASYRDEGLSPDEAHAGLLSAYTRLAEIEMLETGEGGIKRDHRD